MKLQNTIILSFLLFSVSTNCQASEIELDGQIKGSQKLLSQAILNAQNLSDVRLIYNPSTTTLTDQANSDPEFFGIKLRFYKILIAERKRTVTFKGEEPITILNEEADTILSQLRKIEDPEVSFEPHRRLLELRAKVTHVARKPETKDSLYVLIKFEKDKQGGL